MHRHPPFHTEGSASVFWQRGNVCTSGAVVRSSASFLSNAIFMACSYLLHRKNSISFILFCHLITNATMRLLRLLPKVPVTTCGTRVGSVSDSAFCSRRYLSLLLSYTITVTTDTCKVQHVATSYRKTDNTLGKQNNRHT